MANDYADFLEACDIVCGWCLEDYVHHPEICNICTVGKTKECHRDFTDQELEQKWNELEDVLFDEDNESNIILSKNMSVRFRERHLQVGWYIELEEGNGCKKWECSECKGIFRSSQKPWYKYCPHCGIKFINKEDCK